MISVIIPTYRSPNYLDLCLKSAIEGQCRQNQIIVVQDGPWDATSEVIKKYPGIDVVEFPENKGQTAAHNTGVMLAEHDPILIINDDNVFPKNWDTKLITAYHPKRVLAPNQVEPRQSIFRSFFWEDCGITPETFDRTKFQTFVDAIDWKENPYSLDGQTWPVFMSKGWYMILGGLDANYPSPAVADWDFFMRCEMAGLQCHRYHGVHFYHFAGASNKQIDGWNAKESQSFEYFAYKWGFYPQLDRNNSKIPHGQAVRGVQF